MLTWKTISINLAATSITVYFYYLLLATYKEYSTTLLLKYLILLLTPSRLHATWYNWVHFEHSIIARSFNIGMRQWQCTAMSSLFLIPIPLATFLSSCGKGVSIPIQEAIVEMWSHLLLIKETVPRVLPKGTMTLVTILYLCPVN